MGQMSKRRTRGEHYMSFGAFKNVMKWQVGTPAAVVAGGLVGLGGGALLKWAHGKLAFMQQIPPMVQRIYPLIGGALGGTIAYMVTKGSPRGKALAAGALATGALVTVWDVMKAQFPALGYMVDVPLNGYGLIAPTGQPPQLEGNLGVIIDDPRPGMAGLMYQAMPDSDDAP